MRRPRHDRCAPGRRTGLHTASNPDKAPIVVKLVFGHQIRRVVVQRPSEYTWTSLKTLAQEQFSLSPMSTFTVEYRDDEGDLVTVSSPEEFAEALRHVDCRGMLKLWVNSKGTPTEAEDRTRLEEGEILRQIDFAEPSRSPNGTPLQQSRCSSSSDDSNDDDDVDEDMDLDAAKTEDCDVVEQKDELSYMDLGNQQDGIEDCAETGEEPESTTADASASVDNEVIEETLRAELPAQASIPIPTPTSASSGARSIPINFVRHQSEPPSCRNRQQQQQRQDLERQRHFQMQNEERLARLREQRLQEQRRQEQRRRQPIFGPRQFSRPAVFYPSDYYYIQPSSSFLSAPLFG